MMDAQTLQVQTEAHGAVPALAAEVAARKVRSLLRLAPEPVLFARVKLTMAADPAVERPAIAQVNLDLNGRLIRAQATGADMREAVNRMSDRLRIQLERAARNWAATRGGKPVPLPHEWRHQSLPSPRTPYFPRPPEERKIIRHKAYGLARQSPEEASTELELLDYDFYLFTERATGQDSVLYRTADGYRLAQVRPRPGGLGPVHAAVTVSEHPAPRLTLAAATARLEALGQPFLFFVNSQTRRGNLIYHRYDGDYGVITPPGS
jgi:ribosome-associated translation inhibitor RaiA